MAEGMNGTVESQVVRSGAVEGGVVELGKFKIGKLGEALRGKIQATLGLERAKAEVQGNKDADPHIGNLAVKAIDAIGSLAGRRSDKLLSYGERDEQKATFYRTKLDQLREGRIAPEQASLMRKLASVTLEMFQLPATGESSPGWKERLSRFAKETVTDTKESYYAWRRSENARTTERHLNMSVKYDGLCRQLKNASEAMRNVLGNEGRLQLRQQDVEGYAADVQHTTQAEATVREQLKNIMEQGPSLGQGAKTEVMAEEPTDIKAQEKVVANHQGVLGKLGSE